MTRMIQLLSILLVGASSLLTQVSSVAVNEPAFHVRVRSLVFDDTVGLPKTVASEVERTVMRRTYGRNYQSEIAEAARDALQQNGFFKATITDSVRFTTVSSTSQKMVLDAHVIAVPGLRYSLSSISFRGTTVFPVTVLREQFPISDDDVFDISKIRRGIKGMKDLYCTEGYVQFTPIPDFTFDDREQRISMQIEVDEGMPYRVGKLTVEGEESEPGARQRLLQVWTKYEGTYRCNPTGEVLNDLHARPNLPLDQIVKIELDHGNHVVNYTITLGKPASAAAPPRGRE